MEKIKIRGLVICSGWIFSFWGGVIILKGLYDAFIGQPEANHFSRQAWEFISQQQWLSWSGFEITYGGACVALGIILKTVSGHIPEFIERKKSI